MSASSRRDATTERLIASTTSKLSSNISQIRKRALRQLCVASVAGACDRSTVARSPELLRALLSMYDAQDAYTELDGRAAGDAEEKASETWSPATYLTWLCERERVAAAWLEEFGAREYMDAISDVRRDPELDRGFRRLTRALDDARAEARASEEATKEDFESFAFDAEREGLIRRVRERSHDEATTSGSASDRGDSRASFAAGARGVLSARGDGGFELPRVDVSEEDAQYLYALTQHLDTCGHHALALGGLRELRRAVMDLPVEAVTRLAPRALERACELLSATNPKLSTPETRREALLLIQQCVSAMHREVMDCTRDCLSASADGRTSKARAPSPDSTIARIFPPTGVVQSTRTLPIAHVFATHVIPAVCEPSLRASAVRTVRLLLPLLQVAPENVDAQPHAGALLRLGQYLDLWESSLAVLEFESGAASEYLTCVQLSAELAAWAGGAPEKGVGSANKSLAKRWYVICIDEVIAAADPLARHYCTRALIQVHPSLPLELSLVKEADECLRAVATSAALGVGAAAFAKIVSNAAPALSLLGATFDVMPFTSRMLATLFALASASAEDVEDVVAATLTMLTHCMEGVRMSAYATLAAAEVSAFAILEHPHMIEEIIIGGLNHVSTARDAAICLATLCGESDVDSRRRIAAQLAQHAAWLDALAGDETVGKSVIMAHKMIEHESDYGRLSTLSTSLRGLFHQEEKTRIRSATDLAHGISHGLTSAAQVLLRSHDDPFDSVLLTDEEYVREPASSVADAFKESLRLRTFDDVRAMLRRFIFDDVSSREELTAELEIMTSDERLSAVLADPSLLDALIKLAIDSSSHVSSVTGALRILTSALSASALVRDMLAREDGRGGRVTQLLGLVFHPQRRIREAMASFLASFLFSPVVDSVVARAGASRPIEFSLPKVFLETYRFPTFVPELVNPPMVGDFDAFMNNDVDRHRVLYMFRRRQLLMHKYDVAHNEDAALLAFALGDEDESDDAEIRVMRDAARISCSSVVLGNLVGELGEARSHEAAARVVDSLKTNVQASRIHAMSVLASLGRWNESCERFLRRPPRSTSDTWLWVGMAELLTESLESFMRVEESTLPPAALETLINVVRDVIVPLASSGASLSSDVNSDVSRDPPVLRHPIAAGQALGSDGGSARVARATAVHAAMNLLTLVYEAARRFRIFAAPEVDADALVSVLIELDCIGVVSSELISKKSCDYAVRCAAVNAVTAALRLGGVTSTVALNLVDAMLGHVYPSYTSEEHRGSLLMNRATSALLLIMESNSSTDAWSDAFYERCDIGWLGDMLIDPTPRGRARAYDILAAAVGPGSPVVDVIAVEFPNLFEFAAACAIDDNEAAITRAAAFRCVASIIAGSAAAEISVDIPDDGIYAGERSKVAFPSIPMLAAKDVWRGFARVIMNDTHGDVERVSMLYRGASAAMLAAARIDAIGVAEAFDFSPTHETDGNMWHGLFAVLRRATFVGYGSSDSATAASNVATLLGVMAIAGARTFDAKIAAASLRDCLDKAVRALRRGGCDKTARAASRCAEALATMLMVHSRAHDDALIPINGIAAHCAEILASAVESGAGPGRVRASTGACLLASTVFRSNDLSAQAIDGAPAHVGASILQSLLVLWHFRSLGNSTKRSMVPTMSIIISATRNVLAYDLSAKAAACEWGLVESLIQTTREAVSRSTRPDGSYQSVPTAMDVASAARRGDFLGAAMELGMDVDGKELPSTVALGSLTCLRHLMYSCPDADAADVWREEIVNEIRERAVDGGVVSMFQASWAYAKLDRTVMCELLSLVVNFVAKDATSKRAITTAASWAGDDIDDKPKSFAQRLLDYAFESKHEPGSPSLELALKSLASLSTVDGPARYWLVRSVFVGETSMTLAHALTKVRALDDDAPDANRARWMRTVTACVRALAAVASFADGQRTVLRTDAGVRALDLCLEVVASGDADAKREAFVLMHNLAYHADSKSHYAANEAALDCLVRGAGDADDRCASASCAALFALSRSQRIVALLRESGRDRALRAAAKRSAGDTDPNHDASHRAHRARCLRGLLLILSASENIDRYGV
ncbi:Armadillo-type fold [Ostreococcus tauri]|uniref:Armadillo-type fold n=1 Tax=Ostreococcus tauri TaxID=70448 RepID=A0A090ME16_OSTTA|nr:Armadillo-type fold [Ostreococcus tauri]CEG01156.1 Armadillo-type fold [Ostreococcus tauri]|eukprot:XP_022840818.1 Armadillo-type fold [Ostreococcus tauri]